MAPRSLPLTAARIWVVDDSPLQSRLVRELLSPYFTIEEFAAGEELLERLQQGALPALVLLDWQLPGISGLEVCRFVRERLDETALPILMLTSRDAREDFIEGLSAGANDYLAKPFDGVELLARVRTLVRVSEQASQLRSREAELRMVTDAVPLLISFVDRDSRYGLVNSAYENWFGLSQEALRGRKVQEVVGEAAWARLEPFVQRGLAGERFDFEQHAVPYRLGGTRDVKVSFIPHLDALGAADGYVAVLEDITVRRKLEDERAAAMTRVVEVLESISDGFFALDSQWRIALVNHNYERVTGKTRAQTVGRVFWEVFPEAHNPRSDFFQAYHRCMDKREEVQLLDYYPALDLWTDVRAFPTADGGIAVFFRDVTAERQVEEAMKRQADFEKQLIGIVSHDLRNPLNAVIFSSAMLTKQERLSERAVGTVARIQNAAQRANRMVMDLLDFTQARLGGGIRIQPRPTGLNRLVDTVIDEIRAAHPGREVNVLHDGDATGEWDPDRLAQALQNLMVNALKYSPPESPVEVTTLAANGWISILVENQGAPIPAGVQAQIFEPLYRGTGAGGAERSIGLGLYIVKQIVDAHAGTVEVRSTPADGTTFTLRLPE